MRLFAAIFPSQEELDRIVALQDALRARTHVPLRWTKSERIHLTLRFFGDDAEEPRSAAAIEEAVRGVTACSLDFDGVTGFPNPKRARVVVLESCSPAPGVLEIGGRLHAGDAKPFRPHITLARSAHQAVRVHALPFEPIRLQVAEVCLVHSVLAGAEAGYRILRRWRLKG